MNLCSGYENQVECVLTLNNIYNMKLLALCLIGIIFLYLWYRRDKISKFQSTYHYFLFLIVSYMPLIYILTSPFFTLLLSHNISFDIFVYVLTVIYLIAFVLGFGLLSLFAKERILFMISKENNNDVREKRKYAQ